MTENKKSRKYIDALEQVHEELYATDKKIKEINKDMIYQLKCLVVIIATCGIIIGIQIYNLIMSFGG